MVHWSLFAGLALSFHIVLILTEFGRNSSLLNTKHNYASISKHSLKGILPTYLEC